MTQCTCRAFEEFVKNGSAPVFGLGDPPQYFIEARDGDGGWPIHHCPICGGSVEHKTFRLVAEDPAEIAEFLQVSSSARSIPDVKDVLGPPDEILPRDPNIQVVCQYEFRTRWKSIEAVVLEQANGNLIFARCRKNQIDQ